MSAGVHEAATVTLTIRADVTRLVRAREQMKADATAVQSAEIHCYKRFGFCEVASADSIGGPNGVYVSLNSFDIVRWDKQEMIAVDSSPICLVNTLRADFQKHKVTLSSKSKGETKDKMCEHTETPTAFLGGSHDAVKRILMKAKKR